jgi:hypothetical protein
LQTVIGHDGGLACIFHEGGCVCRVFAKRIKLIGRPLTVVAQEQCAPFHFQEKSAVTDSTIATWEIDWRNSLAITLRPIVQAV